MSVSRSRVREAVEPIVTAAGVDLEDVAVSQAGRRSVVRLVVDRDGGVPLDTVADVSRVVSEALDELDASAPGLLGSSYVLEVTSPGVDRPLTAPRHWRRASGRLVKAIRRQGGDVTGRVVSADDEESGAVRLEVAGRTETLPYSELARGQVQVEFDRKEEAP